MSDTKLIRALGISKDKADIALELTIKDALSNYFNTHECDIVVDIEDKTATLFWKVPQKVEIEEAQAIDPHVNFCDSLPLTLDFASFPKPIVDSCRRVFPRVLEEMKAREQYILWKSNVQKAVEGVIVDVDESRRWLEVDLSGQIGIMRREEWIPKEAHRYRKGRVFLFYVLKATLGRNIVQVFLSRCSINLPSVILKQRIPWIKFHCRKRYAGFKSWVHTNSKDQFVKDAAIAARQELNGEVIELILSSPLLSPPFPPV